MSDKINPVNDKTDHVEQTDEETLHEGFSDEALEEAAATGSDSQVWASTTPQCCSYGRC
jgi:hypothetical protein